MAPSSTDGAGTSVESQRRGWWRSPGRILLVALIVAATFFLASRVAVVLSLEAYFGSGYDDRRFDKLETEFDRRSSPTGLPARSPAGTWCGRRRCGSGTAAARWPVAGRGR